jgi:hypothetical protein
MRRSRNSYRAVGSVNKANPESLRSDSQPSILPTCGEVFPDGSTLDLVRCANDVGPQLHCFDGKDARFGEQLAVAGREYRPAELDGAARLVRLPKRCLPFASTKKLFADLQELFVRHGFSPEVALLATFFGVATWFADVLPAAPCLVVVGPALEAALFLDLLSCTARRSLAISEFTRAAISVSPMQLHPTLLISAEFLSKPSIALFKISNRKPALVPVKGRLEEIYCSKALYSPQIFSSDQLGEYALQVDLLPFNSRLPNLHHAYREEIAEKFQGRLLDYRARNVLQVQQSSFDAPDLASSARMLARLYGAPIVGAAELQAELLGLLRTHEEQRYASNLTNLRYVVIESLLHHLHKEPGARLGVGKLTDTANAILQGRGDGATRDPREIGAVLKSLGVRKKRQKDGFAFVLDADLNRNIHRVARGLGVLVVKQGAPECGYCRDAIGSTPVGKRS